MRRIILAAMAVAGVLACSGADEPHNAARVWQSGSWHEIPQAGAAGLVDRPMSITARPGAVYVFNAAPKTIVAIAPDGHLLWRYAPADSVRFSDDSSVALAADSGGRVLVADLAGGHILMLSPLGSLDRVFRIHNRLHLAVRADDWFWGASLLGAAPALFDTLGNRSLDLTTPPTLGGDRNTRGDARLAFAHDTLVVAYMWGGHFLIVAGAQPSARDVPAIEQRPFGEFHLDTVVVDGQSVPAFRADSTDRPATLSMAVDGGLIYDLYWNAQGAADDHHRTVDMYDMAKGSYVGSRRLPLPCKEIAVRDGVLYGLGDDGGLHAWQWTPGSATPH
jgi:outer membrane protein assembly factor BamB